MTKEETKEEVNQALKNWAFSDLWGVHVNGPDEWIACLDEKHANETADKINQLPDVESVDMKAEAKRWPFSNQEYVEAMKRQNDSL